MKYCSRCGHEVTLRVPAGDNMPRYVCDSCTEIHYQNPKIVAGCIPEWGDQILLCRRAIEPRYGLWTLPAGFMENGETTEEAAVRETWEEAEARVQITALQSVFSIPHISQVYLMFRAALTTADYGCGAESLEVRLYRESDIPWGEIAFTVIGESLRRYYADRSRGHFAVHVGEIRRSVLPGS